VIERDEIGHVAIGSYWFDYLCRARGLEPEATFRQLLVDYDAPPLKRRLIWKRAARRASASPSWIG